MSALTIFTVILCTEAGTDFESQSATRALVMGRGKEFSRWKRSQNCIYAIKFWLCNPIKSAKCASVLCGGYRAWISWWSADALSRNNRLYCLHHNYLSNGSKYDFISANAFIIFDIVRNIQYRLSRTVSFILYNWIAINNIIQYKNVRARYIYYTSINLCNTRTDIYIY